ncbi:hypothetical protein COT52_02850 [candidate division WWE3 bacterium CG08_land_8_20_14_0_20_43_13]|uniref:tRNA-dihydrouridine synthase n=1 Tax=candidate division WWE3 bacterium CG08_land_8_20_14_0_20_43_13 TaxID=1975087 RepID=A0A2H0X6S0_UNCKA|nr:MAG: hypothetical protein COT52_02850 [candidate division WWE3 bacterium CG08_land_8_20_14_0_20_43_13]
MKYYTAYPRDNQIIGLAPMDGVTDYPARQIQAKIAKPALMYTEFINVEGLTKKPQAQENRLKFDQEQQPLIVQLWGNNPEYFYQAAKIVAPLGFNGIDINAGCPNPRVLKRGAGGSLIGKNDLIQEIVNGCKNAIKETKGNLPLSIKTRIIGEKEENCRWAEALADLDIDLVCLHGRDLEQRLSGPVDWERVNEGAQIIKGSGKLVLGNGGIKNRTQALEKCKQYNLDGVLIGQAAIGNPWVFSQNDTPTKKELFKTIADHARKVEEFYGPRGFKSFYKHAVCYCRNFSGAKELRIKLLQTKNWPQVENLLNSVALT